MSPLIASLIAGVLISLTSFLGFGSLLLAKRKLANIEHVVVAFAAGGLLGGAFFHLLPESVDAGPLLFPITLLGLVFFFVVDSLLFVYHCRHGHRPQKEDCHGHECTVKPVGWLILFGSAVHNIADGIAVAAAFLVSIPVGVVASLAVAAHEIPKEIGDFGILTHAGFTPKRALFWHLVVSGGMLVGMLAMFGVAAHAPYVARYSVPFAAGGFIYMACTNLLAEIREEESEKLRLGQAILLLLGIGLLWAAKALLG